VFHETSGFPKRPYCFPTKSLIGIKE